MLSMSNVSSVSAAGAYYAEDNYYSEGENQARSAWAGQGAEALGLSGVVDTPSFVDVLSGRVGGQQLGRVTGRGEDGELVRDHRPGYDITLSAPKSVSVLAEVGGAADVRQAHEAATSKVLAFLEKNLVGARVTEGGETRFAKTDNVIAGRFHHTTSRALDPQTHTHLVIANATQTTDGVWRSLANEQLYKAQGLLGAIYDTELAANLRGLGYRLDMGQDGRWEVAGFTREQLDHFSQRSKAIEERLEGFGLTRETASAAQREDAALRTREGKQAVDHAALREDWKERAASVGIDFDRLEADRANNVRHSIDPTFTEQKAGEAVDFALKHLTEREAVVLRGEVLTAALGHSNKDAVWAGVRLDDVDKVMADRLQAGAALATPGDRVTTAEALEREKSMLAMLERGRAATEAIAGPADVRAAMASFETAKSELVGGPFTLTAGQAAAAELTLTSTDRFVALQGYAGVGKTTMLELVNDVAAREGYVVRGMASSGEAALQLQKDSGIESVTTARFLLDEARRAAEASRPKVVELMGAVDRAGQDLRSLRIELPPSLLATSQRRELWVVDESSLMGQREMTSLMAMAERAGAKVAFVGDRLQLNAVEAGKPFEVMQRAGVAGAEMTEISRQRVDDLRAAVAAAVQRENGVALARLESRVTEIPERDKLLRQVAADLLEKHGEDRSKALVIAPLNVDREAINQHVRTELQARGAIGSNQGECAVLVKAGLTDEQKSWAAYYTKDHVVRFGGDLKRLGVAGGDYGRVERVDHDTKLVHLRLENGRAVAWNPAKNSKVEVYKREQRALAIGDEVRFTRPNKELGVVNGTFATVKAMGAESVELQTRAGSITVDRKALQHAHFEYAYAMTVYASQGKTVDAVSLVITKDSGQAMGERSFYVGITRERDDLKIYTDSTTRAMALVASAQEKTSALHEVQRNATSDSDSTDDGSKKPGVGKGAVLEL